MGKWAQQIPHRREKLYERYRHRGEHQKSEAGTAKDVTLIRKGKSSKGASDVGYGMISKEVKIDAKTTRDILSQRKDDKATHDKIFTGKHAKATRKDLPRKDADTIRRFTSRATEPAHAMSRRRDSQLGILRKLIHAAAACAEVSRNVISTLEVKQTPSVTKSPSPVPLTSDILPQRISVTDTHVLQDHSRKKLANQKDTILNLLTFHILKTTKSGNANEHAGVNLNRSISTTVDKQFKNGMPQTQPIKVSSPTKTVNPKSFKNLKVLHVRPCHGLKLKIIKTNSNIQVQSKTPIEDNKLKQAMGIGLEKIQETLEATNKITERQIIVNKIKIKKKIITSTPVTSSDHEDIAPEFSRQANQTPPTSKIIIQSKTSEKTHNSTPTSGTTIIPLAVTTQNKTNQNFSNNNQLDTVKYPYSDSREASFAPTHGTTMGNVADSPKHIVKPGNDLLYNSQLSNIDLQSVGYHTNCTTSTHTYIERSNFSKSLKPTNLAQIPVSAQNFTGSKSHPNGLCTDPLDCVQSAQYPSTGPPSNLLNPNDQVNLPRNEDSNTNKHIPQFGNIADSSILILKRGYELLYDTQLSNIGKVQSDGYHTNHSSSIHINQDPQLVSCNIMVSNTNKCLSSISHDFTSNHQFSREYRYNNSCSRNNSSMDILFPSHEHIRRAVDTKVTENFAQISIYANMCSTATQLQNLTNASYTSHVANKSYPTSANIDRSNMRLSFMPRTTYHEQKPSKPIFQTSRQLFSDLYLRRKYRPQTKDPSTNDVDCMQSTRYRRSEPSSNLLHHNDQVNLPREENSNINKHIPQSDFTADSLNPTLRGKYERSSTSQCSSQNGYHTNSTSINPKNHEPTTALIDHDNDQENMSCKPNLKQTSVTDTSFFSSTLPTDPTTVSNASKNCSASATPKLIAMDSDFTSNKSLTSSKKRYSLNNYQSNTMHTKETSSESNYECRVSLPIEIYLNMKKHHTQPSNIDNACSTTINPNSSLTMTIAENQKTQKNSNLTTAENSKECANSKSSEREEVVKRPEPHFPITESPTGRPPNSISHMHLEPQKVTCHSHQIIGFLASAQKSLLRNTLVTEQNSAESQNINPGLPHLPISRCPT